MTNLKPTYDLVEFTHDLLQVLENQVEHTYDLLKLTCELVKKPEANLF